VDAEAQQTAQKVFAQRTAAGAAGQQQAAGATAQQAPRAQPGWWPFG